MSGSRQQDAQSSKSADFDNSLFLYGVSDPWYLALSYEAMLELVTHARRDTVLGYKIAHFFQDRKDEVFSIPESFPVRVAKSVTPPEIIAQAKRLLTSTGNGDDIAAYQEALGTVQALLMREIETQAQKAKAEVTLPGTGKKQRKPRPLSRYSEGASEKTKQRGANPADWQFIQAYLRDQIGQLKSQSQEAKRPAGYNNLLGLCDYLGISEDMKKLAVLLALHEEVQIFSRFVKWISNSKAEFGMNVFARMAGIPADKMGSYLAVSSPLVRSGIIIAKDGELPKISEPIYKRLDRPGYDFAGLTRDITGEPKKAKLKIENYPQVASQIQNTIDLLKGAIVDKTSGINVLLYGPVGTGKTELTAAIAEAVECELFSPGEKSADGTKALSRSERMAALLLAQALLSNNKNSLLFFDEMEDVLPTDARADKETAGKVFLNRLLEDNRLPVIWAMNKPHLLDESFLRRFTYSIKLPNPSRPVRQTMYKTISHASNRLLSDEMAEQLARQFKAPPALIEAALKFESLASGPQKPVNIGLIRDNLYAASERLYGSKHALSVDEAEASAGHFNPAFINSNVDLASIEANITKLHTPKFTTCLYGPPGTGKSAWARYVANELLGLEVLFKRYSDLSSKWVGETEKNIREAFEEAQDGNMALIIDEADSFLRDRGKAERSWEVTEVNEMLVCLERAQSPVFVTTNLIKELDAASLRRFTFKANFQFIKPEQAMGCFAHFFGMPAPPEIRDLKVLTPGDFANVKKQQAILGDLEVHALYKMLVLECEAKPNHRQAIGFGAAFKGPQKEKLHTANHDS